MRLQEKIMAAMKEAMKSKDSMALSALRAIKSELLLIQTSGTNKELSENEKK